MRALPLNHQAASSTRISSSPANRRQQSRQLSGSSHLDFVEQRPRQPPAWRAAGALEQPHVPVAGGHSQQQAVLARCKGQALDGALAAPQLASRLPGVAAQARALQRVHAASGSAHHQHAAVLGVCPGHLFGAAAQLVPVHRPPCASQRLRRPHLDHARVRARGQAIARDGVGHIQNHALAGEMVRQLLQIARAERGVLPRSLPPLATGHRQPSSYLLETPSTRVCRRRSSLLPTVRSLKNAATSCRLAVNRQCRCAQRSPHDLAGLCSC